MDDLIHLINQYQYLRFKLPVTYLGVQLCPLCVYYYIVYFIIWMNVHNNMSKK